MTTWLKVTWSSYLANKEAQFQQVCGLMGSLSMTSSRLWVSHTLSNTYICVTFMYRATHRRSQWCIGDKWTMSAKQYKSDFVPTLSFFHRYRIFLFLTGSQSSAMKVINSAMKAWTMKTKGCIKFKQRTTEKAYVSFFRGSGYVSFYLIGSSRKGSCWFYSCA